jgi:histidine triad (HIT) family protein
MSDEIDPDCLFCKILAGEIPGEIVAENDHAVALRDIAPVASTHVLVIPRRHVRDATALGRKESEMLGAIFELANEVARIEGIAASGFRLVANVGEDSGSQVAHLHFHCIGGRQLGWPPG